MKPELLAPVGTFEKAKVAFLYGADAVYCGTGALSLRSRSSMDEAELESATLSCRRRHRNGDVCVRCRYRPPRGFGCRRLDAPGEHALGELPVGEQGPLPAHGRSARPVLVQQHVPRRLLRQALRQGDSAEVPGHGRQLHRGRHRR